MANTTAVIVPTSIKLEPKLKARLKKLGKHKRRTVHWLMKDAIRRYVAVEEEAVSLRNETLNRWDEADQDQNVVKHKAVSTWLANWEMEKQKTQCDKNDE